MSDARAAILAASGKTRIVASKKFPGAFIRSFDALEWAGIEVANAKAARAKDDDKKRLAAEATAKLLMLCLCNEGGTPLFSGNDDLEKLIRLDNAVSQSLMGEIADHCGTDSLDVVDAKKNYAETSGDSSPTA